MTTVTEERFNSCAAYLAAVRTIGAPPSIDSVFDKLYNLSIEDLHIVRAEGLMELGVHGDVIAELTLAQIDYVLYQKERGGI